MDLSAPNAIFNSILFLFLFFCVFFIVILFLFLFLLFLLLFFILFLVLFLFLFIFYWKGIDLRATTYYENVKVEEWHVIPSPGRKYGSSKIGVQRLPQRKEI
jgi:hypothetical protein